MKTEREQKEKKIYLECLRVIGLFGVIYCHTGVKGLSLYEVADTGFAYYFSKTMLLFAQICVPLFFMISGTLLLGKNEDLRTHFLRRVLKYAVITAVVVSIQYVYNLFGNPILALWDENAMNYTAHPFSMRELLEKLYTGGVITQHWFLYAYLSFLLILPILRKMAQNMKDEEFCLLFLLFVISSFVFPFLERGLHFEPCDLQFPLLSNIILYPLLGYFCDRKELLAKGKTVVIFGLLSLALTICNMILMERNKKLFDDFHIFFYAMTLFIVVKYLFHRWKCPKKLQEILLFCGKGVFGTYLFENMLRAFCEPVYRFSKSLGQVPALLVFILCVMALGIVIVNFFLRIKKALAFRQNSY